METKEIGGKTEHYAPDFHYTYMKTIKTISVVLFFFSFLSWSEAQGSVSAEVLSKIGFDYSAVYSNGLANSQVSFDYEFCIPKDDAKAAEVKAIEPDVTMPRLAKGRVGCSENEQLCIVSTHGPKWKDRLYALASLPYVKRIVQTDYE